MLRIFSLILFQIPLMKNLSIMLAFLLCILTSCSTQQVQNTTHNEDKLLERVKILSSDAFEGRKTGEKGHDLARAYIIEQFKNINVSGFNGNFEQSFSFTSWGKTYNGVNILAEIKGTKTPEKYIVISAHYDHLGVRNKTVYNGADDNSSGVSALISFAEFLIKNPPKHSIIFAAFDAEELGLEGATHFVENFDKSNIMININMDMISRSKKNELYVTGARYHPTLKTIVNAFENPTSTLLIQGHDGTDGKEDWSISSDHEPFHTADIPFLYFGNEDHNAYHKPTDDFKNITPEFYKNAVRIILAIIKSVDASGLD